MIDHKDIKQMQVTELKCEEITLLGLKVLQKSLGTSLFIPRNVDPGELSVL